MSISSIGSVSSSLLHGMKDCLCGTLLLFKLDKRVYNNALEHRKPTDPPPKPLEKKLLKEAFKSVGISIFTYCSILFFLQLLPFLKWLTSHIGRPDTQQPDDWFQPFEDFLHTAFCSLYLIPLTVISKIICSFYFTDVSLTVYKMRYGNPRFTSLSAVVADFLYNLIFEVLFCLQIKFCVYILSSSSSLHLLEQAAGVLQYSLLYSLLAFEYKWFNMGLDLRQRLKILESKWPYFLGFGLPIYLVNNLPVPFYPNTTTSCINLATFPFFLVSATYASATDSYVSPFDLKVTFPSAWLCSLLFKKGVSLFRR